MFSSGSGGLNGFGYFGGLGFSGGADFIGLLDKRGFSGGQSVISDPCFSKRRMKVPRDVASLAFQYWHEKRKAGLFPLVNLIRVNKIVNIGNLRIKFLFLRNLCFLCVSVTQGFIFCVGKRRGGCSSRRRRGGR